MGTLFSGVGLISGLDISSIVNSLISISARPRDMIVSRIGRIDAQRAALLDVSARISAMMSRITTLKREGAFTSSQATSSNPEALGVSTSDSVKPGTYDFIVKQLATRYQAVSRGFTANDALLTPGVLTIESSRARVDRETRLDELNGFNGVQRGSFELIDNAGNTAVIKVNDAVTLNDVIDKINAAGLDISADLAGDGIALTETSGDTGAVLRVREIAGGHVAADLGFAPGNTISTGGALSGTGLMALSGITPLSALNDGNGVRAVRGGGDFSINGMKVDLSGILKGDTRVAQLNHGTGTALGKIQLSTFTDDDFPLKTEIDLTGLTTMQEIKDAIEGAVDDVTVTFATSASAGSRMIVTYAPKDEDGKPRTDANKKILIEDIDGRAARDLGIAGEAESGKIDGKGLLFVDSVADIAAAINHAATSDGSITAAIDGTGLRIDSTSGGVSLAALNGSRALTDLGFTEGDFGASVSGVRVIGGVNTTMLKTLNGGQGIDLGQLQISLGGASATVDLTGAETLEQVIERINGAGLALRAETDSTGIRLRVESDDGVTPITFTDVSGNFAAVAGLDTPAAQIRGANLQKQHVSETTFLDQLNAGVGVSSGRFKITNSLGQFVRIDLGGAETIGDVIDRINTAKLPGDIASGVTARINDRGDGIVLTDSTAGTLGLVVEDEDGTGAADLNLAGEGETGTIDGSFELNIDVAASDTLDDVVSRINAESRLATATVLNDGSAVTPYRLQINSRLSGGPGELVLDDSGVGLDLSTLSRAQDAVVVFGADADAGVLLTSTNNTLRDVVPGLTLNLSNASDEPITVSITEDTDEVLETIEGLVSAYNAALQRIDALTDFNTETETAGVLLGDSTVRTVESRLLSMFTGRIPDATGGVTRFSQLGFKMQTGELSFDREKFLEAYEDDPQGVIKLFTHEDHGIAVQLEEKIKAITEEEGLLDSRAGALAGQKELLNDRVESMNELLNRKRDRLTRQFLAMEDALAQLQAQQNSLGQIASLTTGFSTKS